MLPEEVITGKDVMVMLRLKNKKERQIISGWNDNGKREAILIAIVATLVFGLGNPGVGYGQGWPDIKTRLLPDAAFAAVEVKVGAKARHCPHHDSNGKLDEEQLIFCLGTLAGVAWIDNKTANIAQKHLETHYNRIVARNKKKGIRRKK